jgi:tetratricopeptide (TPR) repeat protein
MLFDLQSPRRRAAIKVIYGTLAALMFLGLLLFGIGSDVGGLFSNSGGGGGGSFQDQIDEAEKKVEANPRDKQAILDLASLRIAAAQEKFDVDQEAGVAIPTSDAAAEYTKAIDAWDRYLALNPRQPDVGVALQVANAYFLEKGILIVPDGSGQLAAVFGNPTLFDVQTAAKDAAAAQRIAAEADPSTNTYGTLALYLYYAGQTKAADQAAQKALELASPSERKQLEGTFTRYERLGNRLQKAIAEAEKAQQQGGGGGSPQSLEDLGGVLGGG